MYRWSTADDSVTDAFNIAALDPTAAWDTGFFDDGAFDPAALDTGFFDDGAFDPAALDTGFVDAGAFDAATSDDEG